MSRYDPHLAPGEIIVAEPRIALAGVVVPAAIALGTVVMLWQAIVLGGMLLPFGYSIVSLFRAMRDLTGHIPGGIALTGGILAAMVVAALFYLDYLRRTVPRLFVLPMALLGMLTARGGAVTNQRVIGDGPGSSAFGVPYAAIESVMIRKGFIARAFGYGDLVIETTTKVRVILRGIAEPERVWAEISSQLARHGRRL